MAEKVQHFVDNYQMCVPTKPCHDKNVRSPLQQISVSCKGPDDILEVDLVGELPSCERLHTHTHIVTASEVISQYLFAIPIRRTDSTSIVKALPINFTQQQAFVPRQILAYKCSASTFKVLTEQMETACIKTAHATLKHDQKMVKLGRTQYKLQQILKINVTSKAQHKDRYVILAVMARNTTYDQKVNCSP